MKPLIQKLPLHQDCSFVASTFRTPHFEVAWHQHIEYELILFTEGSGLGFVGNHVDEFQTGDIYFLGANLPHTFQKRDPDMITSAVVVQFREDFWGPAFLQMPESRLLIDLLTASGQGLKLSPALAELVAPLILELEHAVGFRRVLILGECLHTIAEQHSFTGLSTLDAATYTSRDRTAIDQVFQYTICNFRERISLEQVAGIACMSIPAFCANFKRSTQKTYIDFLNEVRVGYACSLLSRTRQSVQDICYESGYNTIANFHKQFLKITGCTPLGYRKKMTAVYAL